MFNLELFINKYITKRNESMFLDDILDNKEILSKKIKDKTLLVIGGAGSIGSSFIKCVLSFKPKELVVVDINENALAELTRDLRSTNDMFIPNEYITYPFDYNSETFKKYFTNHHGFDIVTNFSAHKHVRSEKDPYSIEALINNNFIHAKALLDLLTIYPPEEYFCVSTDKAANPVNVMGASKRLMEDLIFSYSDKFVANTARFANVAFSNGSLPDGFLKRISKSQPISAPKDVKRYFVSPIESGHICMLACFLGKGREIFYPKLKEAQMMSFDEIATKLLSEFGYKILECENDLEAIDKAINLKNGSDLYPVHFEVSDTSGEKPYEEFYTETENVDIDRFKAMGVVIDKQICDRNNLNKVLNEFIELFNKPYYDKQEAIRIINSYLPNFKHIETGKSLDDKM